MSSIKWSEGGRDEQEPESLHVYLDPRDGSTWQLTAAVGDAQPGFKRLDDEPPVPAGRKRTPTTYRVDGVATARQVGDAGSA